jgi:hypothetical protein
MAKNLKPAPIFLFKGEPAKETAKKSTRQPGLRPPIWYNDNIYIHQCTGVLLKRPYRNMPTIISAPIYAHVNAGFLIFQRDIPTGIPAPIDAYVNAFNIE